MKGLHLLRGSRRGQTYTLGGITASIIMLSVVLFVLGGSMIQPTSSGATGAAGQPQMRQIADDALDAAVANASAVDQLTYYDADTGSFKDTPESTTYYVSSPPTPLGAVLDRTLVENGYSYNLYFTYEGTDGRTYQQLLVKNGEPTGESVMATRTVVLYDRMRVEQGGQQVKLVETDRYFANDISPDGVLYNSVKLKLVVWKT